MIPVGALNSLSPIEKLFLILEKIYFYNNLAIIWHYLFRLDSN